MDAWFEQLRGRFLVFDGPDGSGKSTQFLRFAAMCRERGVPVCEVREPGGTPIGEQVRTILLDPANTDMGLVCEMLLYMASRAQLVERTIGPALARGECVLADRFISSTLVYQGLAGGLDAESIRAVGRVAMGEVRPEVTVVFDVDEHVAATRLNPLLDRMEQKGATFHRRVRQGYLDLVRSEPQHYLLIDASGDMTSVNAALVAALAARFSVAAG